MSLLEFAKGPALDLALFIFVVGVVWRLVGVVLLPWLRLRSKPRLKLGRALMRGLAVAGTRSMPHKEFIGRTGYGELLGYSYHIGLFIVILAFAPHIEFFRSLFGVAWPALPSTIIHWVAVVTLALLLAVLVRRLTHRVLRRMSNFDDYFSWFVTTLVMVTGLLATAHFGGRYETLLALHILSFDLLLIWFPMGKLMHAFFIFPSRVASGYLLNRKGAAS